MNFKFLDERKKRFLIVFHNKSSGQKGGNKMFFSNCSNVNEVKSLYRKLCFLHHPDKGGDIETIKQVNNEYHETLKSFNGNTIKGDNGKGHTYYYSYEKEQEIIDKINELLALKMKDVKILLVGYWLWIEGNTREYRTELKQAKCVWHGKRKMWYWHGKSYKHRYSNNDFGWIKFIYGCKEFDQTEEDKPERNRLALSY